MKLSAISLVLSAGLAISQVGAAPLRVIVVSSGSSSGFVRVGHAATNPQPHVATLHSVTNMKPKLGCAGSFRAKAAQISNWFRNAFGIAPEAAHTVPVEIARLPSASYTNITIARPYGHPHPHQARPHTFAQRLTRALMMLGPWEGRAVSFILGCGIGVLIRMFWVLVVLAVRTVRGKKREEEFLADEVMFEHDEHEHLLSPPQYADVEKTNSLETPRAG